MFIANAQQFLILSSACARQKLKAIKKSKLLDLSVSALIGSMRDKAGRVCVGGTGRDSRQSQIAHNSAES